MIQLGDCYRQGLGAAEDFGKAFRLYSEAAAADENNLTALARVGNCLVDGVGVA